MIVWYNFYMCNYNKITPLQVDSLLTKDCTSKESIKNLSSLNNFINHCCVFTKYFLTIKKCGQSDCFICKPVRMPTDTFTGWHICNVHMYMYVI